MKLNLIPPSASRGSGSKFAWILAAAIIAGSVYGSISLKAAGQKVLTDAKADVATNQDPSDNVITVAASADTRMNLSQGPLLNYDLAKAMNAHNAVYPEFYRSLFRSIPSYFRITSIQATPADASQCTVTMQGTIGSFQQYANLMLALLRIPGATAVSRSGYQLNDVVVPPLDETDQMGRPIKTGEQRLPDDPIQRLDIRIAEAGATNYVGAGGFGVPGSPIQRGAPPDESLITVAVVINKDLMTPDPRDTIQGGTAAFAASSAEAATASQTGAAPSPTGAAGGAG